MTSSPLNANRGIASSNSPSSANLYGRSDLMTIAHWIPNGARVLDLGCGNGDFLKTLKLQKQVTGYGIELDAEKVAACIASGVNVIQTNLDQGLADFDSDSFDYVVLSLTLQAVQRPRELLQEMLRVGQHGIVTFPNFAHWRNRMQFAFGGQMPVSKQLPFKWYNTPNIHLCTIKDFKVLCEELAIKVDTFVALNGTGADSKPISTMANLLGEIALTKFSKKV
jgi:methionine biosynthesis protein MetW